MILPWLTADLARAQDASWVGDVLIDGEPSNLWARCNPCGGGEDPPNTNWSTDRIPGDDDPFLGDPNTGAVIGPDFVVDHNGGTLDLSTLDVQGGLIVGGLINISDSATINNINLESGGALDGPGPVTLTGSGTWSGVLRSGGGVSNAATLTAATGNLETDLVNSATLVINPSLDFSSTPSLLLNNGNIFLNTDTALNNNSDILDNSGASHLLFNDGMISKSGADLSVIEAPGHHAGGLISASDGTLRFFRNDWQFSGGSMQASNNGRIELTGQVDHVINGTSGISGQGSLLVNMGTFGTLTVTQPFVVDLGGSGEHGLLLEGIGINLEDTLTNRQGGRWKGGTISATGAGRLVNESPMSDPFRIVSGGGSNVMNGNLDSTGWIEQSSTVSVNASHRLSIESTGGLEILDTESSITDWNGDGEVVNAGEVRVQTGAASKIRARFSQLDGGRLITEGALDLRGGGMWSGNTDTAVKGEEGSLVFNNGRFEFGSGTHSFSENDLIDRVAILFAELITTAPDALVTFDLSSLSMNGGGLGGGGRFENRGVFIWESGEFGIDDMIEFINTAGSILETNNSSNLLNGRLDNQGFVVGPIRLNSEAVVNNSNQGIWDLLDGATIGTTSMDTPGQFNNVGSLRVSSDGSESRIDAQLNNSGSVVVFSGSTFRINGPVKQLQNGLLSGGAWRIGLTATLILPGPFNTIGPGTVVTGLQNVDRAEALTSILGGEASATGNLVLDGGLELNNGGRIIVDGQSNLTAPGGVQNGAPDQQPSIVEMLEEAIVISSKPKPPDARVTSSASAGKPAASGTQPPLLTTPLLDNHAILAPGGIGLPGPFNLDGELVLHPGSTLDIDIAGATPLVGHDQLGVTGPMTLAGTIQVTVAEDFFPVVGEQFVIARADGGLFGMMNAVVGTNREDIVWSILETGDEVILEVVDVDRIFDSGFED